MAKRIDVAVYGAGGKLQLVVEIKSKPGASTEWAIQMRRNLLAHSLVPDASYFLLALPDSFYLWKNSLSLTGQALPDYQIETAEILGPYIDKTDLSLNEISQYGFEFLVTVWLEDLINSELITDSVKPVLRPFLFDSGLYEAIKNGNVVVEAEAVA